MNHDKRNYFGFLRLNWVFLKVNLTVIFMCFYWNSLLLLRLIECLIFLNVEIRYLFLRIDLYCCLNHHFLLESLHFLLLPNFIYYYRFEYLKFFYLNCFFHYSLYLLLTLLYLLYYLYISPLLSLIFSVMIESRLIYLATILLILKLLHRLAQIE